MSNARGSRKKGNRIGIRCRSCGRLQVVPKIFLDRATRPRCDRCGDVALPCDDGETGKALRKGRLITNDRIAIHKETKQREEEDRDAMLDRELDKQFGRKTFSAAELELLRKSERGIPLACDKGDTDAGK